MNSFNYSSSFSLCNCLMVDVDHGKNCILKYIHELVGRKSKPLKPLKRYTYELVVRVCALRLSSAHHHQRNTTATVFCVACWSEVELSFEEFLSSKVFQHKYTNLYTHITFVCMCVLPSRA